MTINVYQLGDTVRLEVEFRNGADVLADPATVRFRFMNPLGVITAYEYLTDPELVRDGPGAFHVNLVVAPGIKWRYQFEGSGNGIEIVERGIFAVEPSAFT